MANGIDRITTNRLITTLAGTGILGVVAAGMLAVANDARIAIGVAEQHGQELLMIRGELMAVRTEMLERTQNRFTSRDGASLEKYVERRFDEIEKKLNGLEKKLNALEKKLK